MIHTDMPQNCTDFLLFCKLARSAILWSQWHAVLVHSVQGKASKCKAYLCGPLYSTLKHFSNHAFHNKWFQLA